MIFISVLILSTCLGASEISFDSLCTPSTRIKGIYIDTQYKFRGMTFYGIIEKPINIDAIYCLAKENTPIKKLMDEAQKKEIGRVDIIQEKCALNFESHKNIITPLLAFVHSSRKSNSFVAHLGQLMDTMRSASSFSERNELLQANISLCKCLGLIEMSEALDIIKKINETMRKPMNSDTNGNDSYLIHTLNDSWKRIVQLDLDFARRINPLICEKMLTLPRYSNTRICTHLTDAQRNHLVELELLIKTMRTLQEDAELMIL